MKSESKLWLAIFFGALMIAVGCGGYILIEDYQPLEALYMTVITLATVGFKEIRPLSETGQIFTIFLIVFGAFAGAFIISAMAQLVVQGQLESILGKRKMEKKLQKIKNHIILCGFGRVGKQVAMEFAKRKEPFVIVEKDEISIEEARKCDFNLIQGDAADDDVLSKAGIERARAIVSTLPGDADNVYLALTARQISPDLYIIARAETALAKKKLRRAGADRVVSPHELGGSQMAMATLRPNVVDFMQLAAEVPGGENIGIEEISILESGNLTGKTIIEAAIKSKYDAIVVGLRKKSGNLVFNPSGGTRMDEGDILVVLGENGKLEKLAEDLA